MKGIVITTDGRIYVQTFSEPLYKSIGKEVGGYIEVVRPRGLHHPYVMIVNEEGLLLDLPFNRVGSELYGTSDHGHPIVGNIVIACEGYVDGERDIVGLPDDEIDRAYQAFKQAYNLKGAIPE